MTATATFAYAGELHATRYVTKYRPSGPLPTTGRIATVISGSLSANTDWSPAFEATLECDSTPELLGAKYYYEPLGRMVTVHYAYVKLILRRWLCYGVVASTYDTMPGGGLKANSTACAAGLDALDALAFQNLAEPSTPDQSLELEMMVTGITPKPDGTCTVTLVSAEMILQELVHGQGDDYFTQYVTDHRTLIEGLLGNPLYLITASGPAAANPTIVGPDPKNELGRTVAVSGQKISPGQTLAGIFFDTLGVRLWADTPVTYRTTMPGAAPFELGRADRVSYWGQGLHVYSVVPTYRPHVQHHQQTTRRITDQRTGGWRVRESGYSNSVNLHARFMEVPGSVPAGTEDYQLIGEPYDPGPRDGIESIEVQAAGDLRVRAGHTLRKEIFDDMPGPGLTLSTAATVRNVTWNLPEGDMTITAVPSPIID